MCGVQTKDIDDDEMFTVNGEYTSKLIKVKVPLVAMRSVIGGEGGTGDAVSSTGAPLPESVEDDRKHA